MLVVDPKGTLSLYQIVVAAFKPKQVFKWFFFAQKDLYLYCKTLASVQRERERERESEEGSQSFFLSKGSDLCDSEMDNLLLSQFNL